MERKIKFRYWDGEYKEMCNVRAIVWHDGVIAAIDVEDKEQIMRRPNMFFDHALLQFTGLKDKEGREIYEGDIIRHDKGSRGFSESATIIWEGTSYITKPQIITTFHKELVLKLLHSGMEVIGNIYESPELLKEVK